MDLLSKGTRVYVNDTFSRKEMVGWEGEVVGYSNKGEFLKIKFDKLVKVQVFHPKFISVKENDQHTPTI